MWAPVDETFLIPPNVKEYYSLGAWNGACMDCHVTQGQSRFVAGNSWDSQVAEFGIACEACHSEGRQHIEANRNPIRRFKLHLTAKTDPTITNPSRLKGAGIRPSIAANATASGHSTTCRTRLISIAMAATFRPGAHDLAQRFVIQPNSSDHGEQKDFIRQSEPDFFSNRFWGDGMIRVTGREFNGVQASPCFRGGEFSCLSCHEMHLDSPGQTDPNMGAHRPAKTENGFRHGVFTMSQTIWRQTLLRTHIILRIHPGADVTTAICRGLLLGCCTPSAAIRFPHQR